MHTCLRVGRLAVYRLFIAIELTLSVYRQKLVGNQLRIFIPILVWFS
jgi:hypothetical protein